MPGGGAARQRGVAFTVEFENPLYDKPAKGGGGASRKRSSTPPPGGARLPSGGSAAAARALREEGDRPASESALAGAPARSGPADDLERMEQGF